MPCSASRRNSPLPHTPKQQPTAPIPTQRPLLHSPTQPCSISRSNSPLLHISGKRHSAPHLEHGIGRQTMPRNGPTGPLSPGGPVCQDRVRTRNARTTKRPAAMRHPRQPNGQRLTGQRQRARRPRSHPFGRQLPSARPATARSGRKRRRVSQQPPPGQPATAAGSASNRRRVSQQPPPGQPVTAAGSASDRQRGLDVSRQVGRLHGRGVPLDDLAVTADEELREVPR